MVLCKSQQVIEKIVISSTHVVARRGPTDKGFWTFRSNTNYALEKLDWEKNSVELADILLKSRKLTSKEDLFKRATDFDNRKYTGITKMPGLFSAFVRLKRLFLKNQTN
jgi:hypothetical protein